MSDECRNRVTPVPCDEVVKEAEDRARPSWSVCLPFGGRLWSAYGNVMYDGGVAPQDGTYTSITVQGGCIVGVGHATPPAPTYQPVDCAADPVSCAADLPPLPQETVIIRPADDPTTPAGGDCGCVILGSAQIAVTGDGSADSPYRIEHNRNRGATINGMVFDEYGHLTNTYDVDDKSTANVSQVAGGEFISVDVVGGVASISLDRMDKHGGDVINGEYEIGGWTFTFDRNRIARLEQTGGGGGGGGGGGPLFYHPSPMTDTPTKYRFSLSSDADVLYCTSHSEPFSELVPENVSVDGMAGVPVRLIGNLVDHTADGKALLNGSRTYLPGTEGEGTIALDRVTGYISYIHVFNGPFTAGDYELEFVSLRTPGIRSLHDFTMEPRTRLKQ